MKNPTPGYGIGAFPVTSDATLTSPSYATDTRTPARRSDRRFFWSRRTNAYEPLKITNGQIDHG